MASLRDHIFRCGWRFPAARVLSSRLPVVLLYHGVPELERDSSVAREVFNRHIGFLKEHFEIVSRDAADRPRGTSDRIRVILTFDDGFRNNVEVVAPVLRSHGAPAVFFVSTRHAAPGKYLWFAYLKALRQWFPGESLTFRGETIDMAPERRGAAIVRLRETLNGLSPHPERMNRAIEEELPALEEFIPERDLLDLGAGMSADQVAALDADELFTVGAHTVDHPFLTKCDREEMAWQIGESKRWIEEATGRDCDTFAYPSGDYDLSVIEECRQQGFRTAFAVVPHLRQDDLFERPRIGVYARSVDALGFKVQWGSLMRRAKLKVG